MNWLKNIKIRNKLLGSSLLMILISLIVGIVGFFGMNSVQSGLNDIAEVRVPGIESLMEIKADMAIINAAIWEIYGSEGQTATYKEDLYIEIEETLQKANAARETFIALPHSEEELKTWELFDMQWKIWVDLCNPLIEKFRARDALDSTEESENDKKNINWQIEAKIKNTRVYFLSGKTFIEKLVDSSNQTANEHFESSKARVLNTKILLLAIITGGVFLALFLGFAISTNINNMMKKTLKMIQNMSDGDLTKRLKEDARDELGMMARTMDGYAETLSGMLREIYEAAEQVTSGADQIADSSQGLSKGTMDQATAIEELTASVGQIAEQIKQNAENAGEANKLSDEAMNNANSGNSQMNDMLASMHKINEASSSIAKIIKVIDDIAFQTNILALNAAIEAARAGQYGKGFAVVAQEVRNLAAKSAQAARETSELIERSIQKVSDGTRIANDTARSLGSIVADISKAADLIKQIAVASNEQAAGIAQIDKGIEQVSHVVQANSTTAEESASASEELSGQAQMLKDMVARFRLDGNDDDDAGQVQDDKRWWAIFRPKSRKQAAGHGITESETEILEKETQLDIPGEPIGKDKLGKMPPVMKAPEQSNQKPAKRTEKAPVKKPVLNKKAKSSRKIEKTKGQLEKQKAVGKDNPVQQDKQKSKKTGKSEEEIVIDINDADFGKY